MNKREYVKELESYAETAWQSYQELLKDNTKENLDRFLFCFNYFYNNNKETAETDLMYGVNYGIKRYLPLKNENSKLASKIQNHLLSQGIDVAKMEQLYSKLNEQSNDLVM